MVPAFAATTTVPAGASPVPLAAAGAMAGGATGGMVGVVTGWALVRIVGPD